MGGPGQGWGEGFGRAGRLRGWPRINATKSTGGQNERPGFCPKFSGEEATGQWQGEADVM